MATYELCVLAKPNYAEELDEDFMEKFGDRVLDSDDYGQKLLLYPIDGFDVAHYYIYDAMLDKVQASVIRDWLIADSRCIRFVMRELKDKKGTQ